MAGLIIFLVTVGVITACSIYFAVKLAAAIWCWAWEKTVAERRRVRKAQEERLERLIKDYADHVYPGSDSPRWPDTCWDPPCSHEDYHVCRNHLPHPYVNWDHCDRCYASFERSDAERVGRHRAVWDGSLDDLDGATIHEITDAAWGKR